MGILDLILNLVGLLLWLNWRALAPDPLGGSRASTLLGTLRRTTPSRLERWHLIAALGGLLLFRSVLYWKLGGALDWMPRLELGAIMLTFRSDYFSRMVALSLISFGVTLAVAYLWLLLLSLLMGRVTANNPVGRFVNLLLGWVGTLGMGLKLLLPLVCGTLLWLAAAPVLEIADILPRPDTWQIRVEEAALIGLSTYLTWRYLLGGLLLLHLVNSHIYLGKHPFWSFVSATATTALAPLRVIPLRLAKMDFSPVVGIAIVFLAGEAYQRLLTKLYERLPL